MPQRSNAFQRVVFIVHQSLEPEWAVTESNMLPDIYSGTLREVDITAERLIAGHQLILSIECRDHQRAADVTWVEQMYSKHQLLPTSKLVLWSRSGFTREAIAKAKLLKIDAVSQAKNTRPDWASFADQVIGSYLRKVTPELSPFVDVRLPNGTLQRCEDVAASLFYDAEGNVVGSTAALVELILNNEQSRTTFLDHAPIGEGNFYVEFVPPTEWFADVPSVGRCAIKRIGVGVRTLGEMCKVSTATVHQDKRVVTLATATVQNGTFELLVEELENQKPKFQAKLRGK
ncbi:hypothetical protein [Halopseudomonas oceani]|uniref:Restriction endonuclease type IV Mrr domain-containing protein n=1 Tax=Halopseudomonas oceani TaxID=1708783 RepID=A0A2P4EZB9_9GAMM|nr:hypothetical protein [Halopseudomonas oceani]POB05797.1 hypothetical protein C1949_03695 [Halopseudomonas oceani]